MLFSYSVYTINRPVFRASNILSVRSSGYPVFTRRVWSELSPALIYDFFVHDNTKYLFSDAGKFKEVSTPEIGTSGLYGSVRKFSFALFDSTVRDKSTHFTTFIITFYVQLLSNNLLFAAAL